MEGVVEVPVCFDEVLLAVHDYDFGAFVCRFYNDVGVVDDVMKGPALRCC